MFLLIQVWYEAVRKALSKHQVLVTALAVAEILYTHWNHMLDLENLPLIVPSEKKLLITPATWFYQNVTMEVRF